MSPDSDHCLLRELFNQEKFAAASAVDDPWRWQSERVVEALRAEESSYGNRSVRDFFTPCMLAASLLEALAEAARIATSDDVVLLSPACSGLDQFRNHQYRGQMFYTAVKSTGRGQLAPSPYMHGVPVPA